jgi:hypothetical protein
LHNHELFIYKANIIQLYIISNQIRMLPTELCGLTHVLVDSCPKPLQNSIIELYIIDRYTANVPKSERIIN